MSRRMQKIVIAVVALALVIPAGALGVSSLLGGSTVDPTTWSSADYPRPDLEKPEIPAPVYEQTSTGARESVQALLSSYPYMMTTGDLSVWSELVDDNCSVCLQFMSNAQTLNQQGGYLVGGAFDVQETTFDGTGEPPATGTVTAQFTQAESAIIEEVDGSPYALDAVAGQLQASVAWDGSRWRITDMTLLTDDTSASDSGGASDSGS